MSIMEKSFANESTITKARIDQILERAKSLDIEMQTLFAKSCISYRNLSIEKARTKLKSSNDAMVFDELVEDLANLYLDLCGAKL